jgi:transcriptional regulator with XRE-family HTH domain
MNFYRNFSIMRKKEGFTQEKMAEIFGVSRGAVAKWESGECIPNIELVCRIAEYFNITVDELVLGKKYTNSEITLEQVSTKLDEILCEVKKNNNSNLYKVYCSYNVETFEDEDLADAYFSWGCEEAEKGNYDKALKYFEEAVARGDIRSVDLIIDIYREITDLLKNEENINLYWEYKLQMARKMQECGKILEDEMKRRGVPC